MVNGRLVRLGKASMGCIAGQALLQWVALIANVALVLGIAGLVRVLLHGGLTTAFAVPSVAVAVSCLVVRFAATRGATHLSSCSSRRVKDALRRALYQKMLDLGPAYGAHVATSEVVQVAGEGVEQIETYFGLYLPQLFYALLAPLTLFAVIAPMSLPVAVVLGMGAALLIKIRTISPEEEARLRA